MFDILNHRFVLTLESRCKPVMGWDILMLMLNVWARTKLTSQVGIVCPYFTRRSGDPSKLSKGATRWNFCMKGAHTTLGLFILEYNNLCNVWKQISHKHGIIWPHFQWENNYKSVGDIKKCHVTRLNNVI